MTRHYVLIAQQLPGIDPSATHIDVPNSQLRPLVQRLKEINRELTDPQGKTQFFKRRYFFEVMSGEVYGFVEQVVERK